ncbi:MAG: hypothetical protein NWQ32_16925, partial [Paracoccaceae bacterium]|nr:hypothetical protein [Paracoccaceae bacterium]
HAQALGLAAGNDRISHAPAPSGEVCLSVAQGLTAPAAQFHPVLARRVDFCGHDAHMHIQARTSAA